MDNNSLGEKQLFSRLKSMTELSVRHCKPYYSDFLNELQISKAIEWLKRNGVSEYVFWGGYENAERLMLSVYPEYLCPMNSEFPVECISVRYRTADKLNHRDFLGSLMSYGIKREAVGDIVVGEGITSFFVKEELSDYIRAQMCRVGRTGVQLTEQTVDFESITQDFQELEGTVSSLRLDSVLSAALKLSRSKTQALIETGLVVSNSLVTYNSDSKISSGDRISVRGYGKFTVEISGEMTRKGKYRILIKKFK